MKNNKVIYTCITNNYDELVNHTFSHPDFDYVCFVNNEVPVTKKNSEWTIKKTVFSNLDDVRNQRWHKLHPHLLFPNYDYSIWIDGNIDILSPLFFTNIISFITKKEKAGFSHHPDRNCIYDELEACLKLNKDDTQIMMQQVKNIRNDNYPKNNGLVETSVIYRNHHHPQVISLMEKWWEQIANFSKRDQLSFNYTAWKQDFELMYLEKTSHRNLTDICKFYPHFGGYKEEIRYWIYNNNIKDEELNNIKNTFFCRIGKFFSLIKE